MLQLEPMTTCDRCELTLKPAPSAQRVYCTCGKAYAGGGVVTDPPVQHRDDMT